LNENQKFKREAIKIQMRVLVAILATVIGNEVATSVETDERATGGSLEPVIGGSLPTPPPNPNPGQLIWHGESDVAKVVNKAGEWNYQYIVDNMFDGKGSTSWHSNGAMRTKVKVIGVEFKRSMTFNSLTIQKRFDCCRDRYQHVCLVLDGNTRDELCTDTLWGFDGDRYSNFITWKKRVEGVRKVELHFRETNSRGHAQIAELEIAYTPALVWQGDPYIATITNNGGEYNDGMNWNKYQVWNMFDSDIHTMWHSAHEKRTQRKSMAVTFKQPIKFTEISIVKRQDCCADRYKNVCLVLDDNVQERLCTDADYGFANSNQYSNTITWKNIRNDVSKVELVFNEVGDYYGHAQIAEMEIIYNNERNDRHLTGECFIDQIPRELDAFQINLPGRLTLEKCIALCNIKEYKYAGMQYANQCFCDNHYPAVEIPQFDCDMLCDGDDSQFCGGYWKMNVYSTDYRISMSMIDVRELVELLEIHDNCRGKRAVANLDGTVAKGEHEDTTEDYY